MYFHSWLVNLSYIYINLIVKSLENTKNCPSPSPWNRWHLFAGFEVRLTLFFTSRRKKTVTIMLINYFQFFFVKNNYLFISKTCRQPKWKLAKAWKQIMRNNAVLNCEQFAFEKIMKWGFQNLNIKSQLKE